MGNDKGEGIPRHYLSEIRDPWAEKAEALLEQVSAGNRLLVSAAGDETSPYLQTVDKETGKKTDKKAKFDSQKVYEEIATTEATFEKGIHKLIFETFKFEGNADTYFGHMDRLVEDNREKLSTKEVEAFKQVRDSYKTLLGSSEKPGPVPKLKSALDLKNPTPLSQLQAFDGAAIKEYVNSVAGTMRQYNSFLALIQKLCDPKLGAPAEKLNTAFKRNFRETNYFRCYSRSTCDCR